jgi:hypothetical protein
MTRQLHLAGFLWASHLTHSHAQWRHPRQDPDWLTPEYYVNLARLPERHPASRFRHGPQARSSAA